MLAYGRGTKNKYRLFVIAVDFSRCLNRMCSQSDTQQLNFLDEDILASWPPHSIRMHTLLLSTKCIPDPKIAAHSYSTVLYRSTTEMTSVSCIVDQGWHDKFVHEPCVPETILYDTKLDLKLRLCAVRSRMQYSSANQEGGSGQLLRSSIKLAWGLWRHVSIVTKFTGDPYIVQRIWPDDIKREENITNPFYGTNVLTAIVH